MSKRKAYRQRYDPLGNARIIATAMQTAEQGSRTTLLLQAREALISAQAGSRDKDVISRLGNAVDYALILSEGAKGNVNAIEQIKRGQDAVMALLGGHVAYLPDIRGALDVLDQLFELCDPMQIGKARQEWYRRASAGLTLEIQQLEQAA